jgi:hypothetical protein
VVAHVLVALGCVGRGERAAQGAGGCADGLEHQGMVHLHRLQRCGAVTAGEKKQKLPRQDCGAQVVGESQCVEVVGADRGGELVPCKAVRERALQRW